MPIVKEGQIADDPWVLVDDAAPLPGGVPLLLSLARWQAERNALEGRNAPLGVRLAPGEGAEDIAEDVDRLSLIALEFPTFKDGRAYSTARRLRQVLGFRGELRATGDVLRDQWLFMVRCGFDAVEVAGAAEAAAWETEMRRFSVVYQRAADDRQPAGELRQMRRAAE